MRVTKAVTFRASSIGDCLMGKYLLENVHAEFPEAKLGLVVASRSEMIRELCAGTPYIEVVEANRKNIFGLFQLWKKFHGSDLVVTQYAGKPGGTFSLSTKLFARLLSRRGGLVGFEDAFVGNRFLYDHLVGGVLGVAPAELEREALTSAGIAATIVVPSLRAEETTILTKLGLEPDRYIVVHLFAGNRGRGLSPEKKKELIQSLVRSQPSMQFVLTGGKADLEEAKVVAEGTPVIVAAGETRLQEMQDLLSKSTAVVSVDTGGAHIAAQLKKPLVVLGSCLGLHWWKPEQYGKNAPIQLYTYAEPNGHVFKNYPDCLNKIDMEEVAAQVKANVAYLFSK